MPMRWRWPPENSWGNRLPCSRGRPTASSSSPALTLAALRLTPWTTNGSLMMSLTGQREFSDEYGSWKTTCISVRSLRSSPPDIVVTSCPRNRTEPDVGSMSRRMLRPRVVLPQPDSPTMPKRLVGVDREADAVEGVDGAHLATQQPGPDREVRAQVVDHQQRLGAGGGLAELARLLGGGELVDDVAHTGSSVGLDGLELAELGDPVAARRVVGADLDDRRRLPSRCRCAWSTGGRTRSRWAW